MQVEPASSIFEARYMRGEPQLVFTRLVSDLETPVSAFLKLAGNRQNAFLLESVEGGAVRGRYSMLGFDPDLLFRAEGGKAEIARAPDLARFTPCREGTLEALRKLIDESRIAVPADLPPMAAGVFGYLSYDMVRLMEALPEPKPEAVRVPDAVLIRPRIVAIFDAVKDELTVVTPVRPEPGVNPRAAYDRAINRLIDVIDALDKPVDHAPEPADVALSGKVVSNTTPAEVQGDGRARQGLHRRRRYLPGGALAAFRGAVSASRLLALPRASPGEPLAVPLLPRF